MDKFLPTLIILTAAGIAILLILYRVWKDRVEEPRQLKDELKEALDGTMGDVYSIEPRRQIACGLSYDNNKLAIVGLGNIRTRIYSVKQLYGVEVFTNRKLFARVLRAGSAKPLDAGSYRAIDDLSPEVSEVRLRLVFDDPSNPDLELDLWLPGDSLSAMAEGPNGALKTARQWFYHVEAALRRPKDELELKVDTVTSAPPEAPKPASPPPVPTLPEPKKPFPSPTDTAAPEPAKPAPKRSDADVLNAPLVPYVDMGR